MREFAILFKNVSRHFADVKAVDDVTLVIEDGEFFSMLGPSGSGKTTCLRMIAGFDRPTSGQIFLYGQDVSDLPPYERPVNTVFQDYALFPHMNVEENIAYGLMIKKVAKKLREQRVDEMLNLVRLPGLGHRKPSQLSGGQRQRVALARALINHPRVLLLDEPLGALDLKLRQQMQVELKNIQKQVGITFVFVTHDQEEALTMSDRVAVFSGGKIEQVGSPAEVYEHPATPFVAGFVGTSNLIEGEMAQRITGSSKRFSIRPEKIHISDKDTAVDDISFGAGGRVRDVIYLGLYTRYLVELDGGGDLVVVEQNLKSTSMDVMRARGKDVRLHWLKEHVRYVVTRAMQQNRLSNYLYRRPRLLLALLIVPPLVWFVVVYLGALAAMLLNSFYSLNGFTGQVVHEFTLDTYAKLFQPENLQIFWRTTAMAICVTLACIAIAFPLSYYMARFATARLKTALYLAVTLPLWSSYVVRVYSWQLLLAQEGIVSWLFRLLHIDRLLNLYLQLPGVGGTSLSVSATGIFLVFVYIWLPYMVLPIQTALERVPRSLLEASGDLGARPSQTFRNVILPLALPGVVAGSIFTFSLTLGDFIVPTLFGNSSFFIGKAVLTYEGTSGNIPLAAAFTMGPIVIMIVYLLIARRLGAFDAL